MKKRVFAFFISIACLATAFAQIEKIPVFLSGTDGYQSYRIPAIIRIPNGDLLAFCEGRVHSDADFGNIKIVMKRSRDGGRSWTSLETVVDYDSLQAGNPAPVTDLTDPDYPQGRIYLFYNTGNNAEGEVRRGRGLREAWYKTSVDGGLSWSAAVNITLQVHRPRQPGINPAYDFKEDWRSYANTPGHAIQFAAGKYKGRIYVAANHSAGEPQSHFTDYSVHGYYTDDHGKTFHISGIVPISGGNEVTAAELSHDRLMINARNQKGDIKSRIVAISGNGGENWDTAYFDGNLPDPICQGSLLIAGRRHGKMILAFCNPADTTGRDNLTLRISMDEGATWMKNYIVDRSGQRGKKNYTAYSDLVKTGRRKLGILYERADNSQIVFTVMKW